LAKERRLGRGLEALLGRLNDLQSETASEPRQIVSSVSSSAEATARLHGNGEDPGGSSLLSSSSPEGPGELTVMGNSQSPPGAASARATLSQTGSRGEFPGRSPGRSPIVESTREGGPLSQGDETGRLIEVEISQIDSNPFQPRGEFPAAEIQSLADSLRAHGLLQPLIVRRHGDRFQLVAGERRLRAAVQAGWRRVPVRVVEADDRELAELALVENLHRKDLNPLEKAISFQRYLREFGVTQEQLASRLKMDRSTIANLIRLLELPAPVQQALRDGRISQAHARALLSLGDERTQLAFCERIQKEGWSVRQTEAMVNKVLAEQEEEETDQFRVISADPPARPSRSQSQHIAALEREFRLALGTNVQIIHTRRGKGRVIIHFRNHDEFERIRRQICEGATVPQAKAS
jgi:ParB family chromosome partitioning protein